MNFAQGWKFPIEFGTPLGSAAWAALIGVPVGIVLLYFLKLRRRPVQVPSTLLWRRSLEDLHVNSLFQRLRKNLLLFLQLLFVALAMLALAAPKTAGTLGQGARYVIAIDNSSSMRATDVKPTRLDEAKAKAKKVVANMNSADLAMVITFSDRAKVVSNYTGNRQLLEKRIDEIEAGESTTSLREALEVAAGLANPTRQIEGVVATSIVSPTLLIYTDGGFADVDGFSLGNLNPEVVVIGTPPAPYQPKPEGAAINAPTTPASNNVAIVSLQTRRNDEKPDIYQVFGRVHNYRDEVVATEAQLFRKDPARPNDAGTLIDAIDLAIPASSDQAFKFELPDTGATELEVRINVDDDQPLDNRAFSLVGSPRKAQVLLVTEGDRFLLDALKTPMAQARAEVVVVGPEALKTEPVKVDLASGKYDLVIFDRSRPEISPQSNTLYFGSFPPGVDYDKPKAVDGPEVIDVNSAHPLMQYIRDLSVVTVLKAEIIEPPKGSTVLIDSKGGPLAFISPREGFSDVVMGFGLVNGPTFNTDWVTKYSFPIFLFNALQLLGNARDSAGEDIHLPGQSVMLRPESLVDKLLVAGPGIRKAVEIGRSPQGSFIFNDAEKTGLYHVEWKPQGLSTFAVNQFDSREADLSTRGLIPAGTPQSLEDSYLIKIGYNPVASSRGSTVAPSEWWRRIAFLALGLVLFEWYIYNRRVYI